MANCSNCNKSGCQSRCGGCHSVYYCNTECQRSHWKKHKKECKKTQKQLKENINRKENVEQKDNHSNITSAQYDPNSNVFRFKMADNKDQTFINNLTEEDITEIFETICDSSASGYSRMTSLNSLVLPRIPCKYPLYEKCGLLECFQKVLLQSHQNLKDGNHDSTAFEIQMFTLHFLTAIVMIKNYNNTGNDNIDEIYSLKLLKYAHIWKVYFEMIQLRYCHLEFVRLLFRVFTLMMNSYVCAKYIIDDIQMSTSLEFLMALCNETVDKSTFIGCTETAFDAAQGLSWNLFCQIEIQCQNFNVRDDILTFLKKNENKMYKMISYHFAEKSIREHRGISMEEGLDALNEALSKKMD